MISSCQILGDFLQMIGWKKVKTDHKFKTITLNSVLSIVAGWRESGGENFWGRVEKSKIFTFFGEHQRYLQKIQLLHFKISKIVAVWPRIVVAFLVKFFGAGFGGLWLQKWRFLIWNS